MFSGFVEAEQLLTTSVVIHTAKMEVARDFIKFGWIGFQIGVVSYASATNVTFIHQVSYRSNRQVIVAYLASLFVQIFQWLDRPFLENKVNVSKKNASN